LEQEGASRVSPVEHARTLTRPTGREWQEHVTTSLSTRIGSSIITIIISSPSSSQEQTQEQDKNNMSVLLETSAGDITIDLYVDEAPLACEK
jgi:hypothetical protein